MNRPELNKMDLDEALEIMLSGNSKKGALIITMSPGQWDELLNEAYNYDGILLEIDDNEQPVAAYRKQAAGL